MVKKFLLCAPVLFSLSVHAADTPFEFGSEAEAQRFQGLIEELRCMVCQNQSLADSNAELAQDLRAEVYAQMHRGLSDAAIASFLVTRYGDFVLYRPPLKKHTWALWFGPVLLLLLGLVIAIRLFMNNSRRPQAALTQEQRQRLKSLLQDEDAGAT